MRACPIVLIALGALAVAPGTAGAKLLGPATGVSAVRAGRTVDVTFTPAALAASRLKAGRTVSLDCTVQGARSPLLLVDADSQDSASGRDLTWGDGKVGADGVAHVKLLGNTSDNSPGPADTCDVERVRHLDAHNSESTVVAHVPLTPAGATTADETERATALRRLLQKAHTATGYQPVAALGAGVVAMDSPDATPPAGAEGYWTDGTRATVATLSAGGRRLVIQDLGGNVLGTNVLTEMDPYGETDDLPPGAAAQIRANAGAAAPRSPDADRTASPDKSDTMLLPGDGVRATVSGHRATVRFTGRAARTFRALRGRRVTVACQTVPVPSLFPDLIGGALAAKAGSAVARVPAHGGAITVTLKGDTGDVCNIIDDFHGIAVAGGTAAGRAWMQDLAALLVLDRGDVDVAAPGGQAYRSTGQLVAAGRKLGYVAMSGPDGAVPVGEIGIWSDGARQAAMAVRSASGHRFFVADGGDGIYRSNLLSAFSWLFITETFGMAETTSGGSSTNSGSGSSSGSLSGEFEGK